MTKRDGGNASRTGDHMVAKAAMSTSVLLAAGTHAYAEAIRFDNPDGKDHFTWFEATLDITRAADAQTGAVTTSSLTQAYDYYYGFIDERRTYLDGSGADAWRVPGFPSLVESFAGGTTIGPALSGGEWSPHGTLASYYADHSGSEFYSLIPLLDTGYLGVRFNAADGVHYGWVAVTRSGGSPDSVEIDALAWGYETEAGVAIEAGAGTIPAPGTLAALAFGAGALGRRRTRGD